MNTKRQKHYTRDRLQPMFTILILLLTTLFICCYAPMPLHIVIKNSNEENKVNVKVYDPDYNLIFNETYYLKPKQEKHCNPPKASREGSYLIVITVNDRIEKKYKAKVKGGCGPVEVYISKDDVRITQILYD